MVANIVSLISKAFLPSTTKTTSTALRPISSNPFANPFMTSTAKTNYSYAKNNPIQGGYFAGYYNGKANIVGQRVFVEA